MNKPSGYCLRLWYVFQNNLRDTNKPVNKPTIVNICLYLTLRIILSDLGSIVDDIHCNVFVKLMSKQLTVNCFLFVFINKLSFSLSFSLCNQITLITSNHKLAFLKLSKFSILILNTFNQIHTFINQSNLILSSHNQHQIICVISIMSVIYNNTYLTQRLVITLTGNHYYIEMEFLFWYISIDGTVHSSSIRHLLHSSEEHIE